MFVVHFKFNTHEDYGFPYVPRGTKYDGESEYELSKEFSSKAEAIDYAVKVADYFSANIENTSGNIYVMNELKRRLYEFEEDCLKNKNENVSTISTKLFGGKYEGTEFYVKQKMNHRYFDIPLTDTQNTLVSEHAQELRNEMREFVYKRLEEYAKEHDKN